MSGPEARKWRYPARRAGAPPPVASPGSAIEIETPYAATIGAVNLPRIGSVARTSDMDQ